jgi:Tfp pilus assembly protein PilF
MASLLPSFCEKVDVIGMRSSTQIALLSIMLFCALPAPVFAASPAMRQASQTLLSRGLATQDAKRAQRFLEQSIVADPANAAAFSALGNLYERQGERAKARKYYDLAFGADPVDPTALSGAAALDLAEGKIADAQDKLRKLKIVCPACKQTHELENALKTGTPAATLSNP